MMIRNSAVLMWRLKG